MNSDDTHTSNIHKFSEKPYNEIEKESEQSSSHEETIKSLPQVEIVPFDDEKLLEQLFKLEKRCTNVNTNNQCDESVEVNVGPHILSSSVEPVISVNVSKDLTLLECDGMFSESESSDPCVKVIVLETPEQFRIIDNSTFVPLNRKEKKFDFAETLTILAEFWRKYWEDKPKLKRDWCHEFSKILKKPYPL